METKVSIVVPIYKVPIDYLNKCVQSLMTQTMREIEIILVDDGSPDDCGVRCDRFADQDDRIKVVHQNNAGLSAARNTGVQHSTGKWIMFVDGDDWIEPSMCEKMLTAASAVPNAELIMCGVYKTYGDKDIPYKYDSFRDMQVFDESGCEKLQTRLLDFDSWIACSYAKLISREYLEKYNIMHDSELRQGVEGLEFNIRMFEHLTCAVFVKQWFYHYVYNEGSISVNLSEQTNQLLVLGFNKINSFILQSKNKAALEMNLMNRMHFAIISTAIRGYFNPNNGYSYKDAVKGMRAFIANPLVAKALKTKHTGSFSRSRIITLFCIKNGMYRIVSVIAKARMRQLASY